jgi:hypothetical protein
MRDGNAISVKVGADRRLERQFWGLGNGKWEMVCSCCGASLVVLVVGIKIKGR